MWDWILRTRPVSEGRAKESNGGDISEFRKLLDLQYYSKKKTIMKKNKKIKQTKNDQKIGFSRKIIYRKMWVSREIEIPEWEEVPSLRDRNNIYYIEYYIEVWSPARERNLEKVWRLRGWYLTIYTKKKNMTWIFSQIYEIATASWAAAMMLFRRYVHLLLFFQTEFKSYIFYSTEILYMLS